MKKKEIERLIHHLYEYGLEHCIDRRFLYIHCIKEYIRYAKQEKWGKYRTAKAISKFHELHSLKM